MNFAFSEEQEAFREGLRGFLEDVCPPAEVFRLLAAERGFEPALWKRMAGELGLQGLLVPEALGGQGFGFLELAIALEEAGRVLLPAPLYASACLATGALLAAGTPAQRERWLPGLASGERIGSLALLEPGGAWDDAAAIRLEARPAPGGGEDFVLEGEKTCVLDGQAADLLVVAARLPGSAGEEGLCLLAVEGGAFEAEALPTLDPTRRQARVRFRGAPATCLGEPGAAAAPLRRTLELAAAGLAAEMVGGADRCLADAVAYAKQRTQFARPIGSFQAVKHACAEVLLELELARSASWWASWAVAEDNEDRGQAARLAKAACSDAFLRAAAANIQVHGGIGFTWEATPHLYYRRAKVGETLFGDPVHHRAELVRGLGIGA